MQRQGPIPRTICGPNECDAGGHRLSERWMRAGGKAMQPFLPAAWSQAVIAGAA
jgi:hypothetical protein